MAKERALTKSDLVLALKEVGVVTKADLEEMGMVTEESLSKRNFASKNDIYDILAQFYTEIIKPEFKEVKVAINKVDMRLIHVESEVKFLRQDVRDINNEFVNYVPKVEFEKFKAGLQS